MQNMRYRECLSYNICGKEGEELCDEQNCPHNGGDGVFRDNKLSKKDESVVGEGEPIKKAVAQKGKEATGEPVKVFTKNGVPCFPVKKRVRGQKPNAPWLNYD